MSGTTMVILSAFVAYLLLMIVIGVVYMKKTSSSEDYFLGGRGLNAWVAALSAQASDMSGWLLMGLPGAIYSLGTGQIWIAVGLFIGTVLNWVCISHRLRKYTIAANNSLTIPAYFENRFQDKKRILLLLSSIVIVIFFLVYTASALAAGGKLFNTVFGIDYHIALAIGAAVILCYTFMGGFMAVCVTDFVQGTLMLIGLLIVPLVAYLTLSGSLSDLLTPWELIEERLRCAAKADFVICLYNPSSRKRSTYLAKACEIMLEYKAEDTVCGIVKNIARDGETMQTLTLKELKETTVDMFSTVFIGNKQTKVIREKMVTPRGYRI